VENFEEVNQLWLGRIPLLTSGLIATAANVRIMHVIFWDGMLGGMLPYSGYTSRLREVYDVVAADAFCLKAIW
jgi:hypothetical protein